MTHLLNLVQYDKWANDRTFAYMQEAKNPPPKVAELFDHILFAQQVWIDRIKGRPSSASVKSRSSEETSELMQKLYDEYLEFLSWTQADEMDSIIHYNDSKGNVWSNTLRDIIVHVCNHSSYHRGQIALLTREAGDVPVATDYIAMMRER